MTIEYLRAKLSEYVARENADDHALAEEALLDYINDPELTRLWKEAAESWWYA